MQLRQFRAEQGWSLTKLAGELGVPVSTVHGWMAGRRMPSMDAMETIARVTGGAVMPNDFMRVAA